MSNRVLIVDDDRFLLENVRKLLTSQGYEVDSATSGEDAIKHLSECSVDLMVLDVGLPGIDGISLCRRIRSKWHFPVIMLTARTDAMDKVVGLEVGADDYLTKPFEPMELLARVRAQLRRSTEYQMEATLPDRIEVGDLVIDGELRDVLVSGQAAGLTNREYELLEYLARNSGRVLSRDTLFEKVWGYEIDFNSNSLDVYIYRIRKKIEPDPDNPRYLHTLRGYGYKFQNVPASS